jgi:putative transposase
LSATAYKRAFNNTIRKVGNNLNTIACPAEVYIASKKEYKGLPELDYPLHDREIIVTSCGRLCLHRKKINISTVFAGQKVGISQVDDKIWLVQFMKYDLGYFDETGGRLEPINNPFYNNLYTMSQV